MGASARSREMAGAAGATSKGSHIAPKGPTASSVADADGGVAALARLPAGDHCTTTPKRSGLGLRGEDPGAWGRGPESGEAGRVQSQVGFRVWSRRRRHWEVRGEAGHDRVSSRASHQLHRRFLGVKKRPSLARAPGGKSAPRRRFVLTVGRAPSPPVFGTMRLPKRQVAESGSWHHPISGLCRDRGAFYEYARGNENGWSQGLTHPPPKPRPLRHPAG